MERQGQAALEFLATYGWGALLVVITVLVMAYFSVINPHALIPDMCQFPDSSNIDCTILGASSNGDVTVRLQNIGQEATFLDATCKYEGGVKIVTKNVLVDGEQPAGQAWPKRGFKEVTCQFDGDNPLSGHANEKQKLFMEISLQRDKGIVSVGGPLRVLVSEGS